MPDQAPLPGMCVQGSARVIRCLQDAREELTYECRATLFDAEVRMAEDIDFKYPMKRACTAEIQAFCPGVEHGHARVRAGHTLSKPVHRKPIRVCLMRWHARLTLALPPACTCHCAHNRKGAASLVARCLEPAARFAKFAAPPMRFVQEVAMGHRCPWAFPHAHLCN